MFARLLSPTTASCLLLGPRGTGKSTWIRHHYPDALVFDLLDYATYTEMTTRPDRFEQLVAAAPPTTVVIDEVQRVPALLDEVHRLIETRGTRFVLTGSSARKLRRGGVNLLAGRARTMAMHPLCAAELGDAFDVHRSLRVGHLPTAHVVDDPERYLSAYVGTYLREEVMAEALTRNLDAFTRFLTAASFSQASVLSVTTVARDSGVSRKTVEGYFDLLDDLLIAFRLPVFQRRAKRDLTAHPKFYFFDAGVYRAIRPRGPLDPIEEIEGAAIETLVAQDLRAVNDGLDLGYALSFWRTRAGQEVDFVLYGERGLIAIEVKRSSRYTERDLAGLRTFGDDYPVARRYLFYGGRRAYDVDGIRVLPLAQALPSLPSILDPDGGR
jgi:predicted AAA+ superfamily ATPase